MITKNALSKSQILAIAGGIISIIGVFLPWYSASMTASAISFASSISVNGLGWKNGEGLLLGMISGDVNWQFQGIGSLSGKILGATMQSGAGYGLYVVLLGGAVAATGGLIAWRDFHQTSV